MKKARMILCGAIVLFLLLSGISSWYLVSTARSQIASLGEISYDSQSRQRIDAAGTTYEALSIGLGASLYLHDSINDYVDYPRLREAEASYVTQAIEHAGSVSLDDESAQAVMQEDITEAREVLDAYFSDQDYSLIPNYDQLLLLENQ